MLIYGSYSPSSPPLLFLCPCTPRGGGWGFLRRREKPPQPRPQGWGCSSLLPCTREATRPKGGVREEHPFGVRGLPSPCPSGGLPAFEPPQRGGLPSRFYPFLPRPSLRAAGVRSRRRGRSEKGRSRFASTVRGRSSPPVKKGAGVAVLSLYSLPSYPGQRPGFHAKSNPRTNPPTSIPSGLGG